MESTDSNSGLESETGGEIEVQSCQKGLTRQEFIKALIKKSVAAGVLLTAVSAVETYDMPAAYGATTF